MKATERLIKLANPRGFCAGVDRAIDIVNRALEIHGAPVYVKHEVVHNKFVVEDLKRRGAIFIEEIDEQYLDIVTPKEERRFNPMLSADIFGDVDPNIIRYKKPAYLKAKPKTNESFKITAPKNLKKVSETKNNTNLFDNKLIVGDVVNHQRFGKGNVLNIEGKAADLKAEIKFENGGVKKLLLRFAKLEIIS